MIKSAIGPLSVLVIASCDSSPKSYQSSSAASYEELKLYQITDVGQILSRRYPELTLQNPTGISGNWSFVIDSTVLSAGNTFSQRMGKFLWEKIVIPPNSKNAFIPVLLYRPTGETAFILLEGSREKFEHNAEN